MLWKKVLKLPYSHDSFHRKNQNIAKKNHVSRVFLIRYFWISPQNKDHHSIVSWARNNFVRRALITILSWWFWWKNSKNRPKKSCKYCIFAQTLFYFTIKKGCHYRVILIEFGFIKSTQITPLSWLFFTKISKTVSKKPFKHHNMLVIFMKFFCKNDHESRVI